MNTVLSTVDLAEDRWPGVGNSADQLSQLVLASNLLGADRRVACSGGGSTSAKGAVFDHAGRETRVLWVKSVDSDFATMRAEHFAELRMDDMELLIARTAVTHEEIAPYLERCMTGRSVPRSSAETLLHASIPAAHVHYTQPDAINMLASTKNGEALIRDCFGDAAAWIPCVRPDFDLAKQVGQVVRANANLRLIVLAKHGLVCWGNTAEEAYHSTIEVTNLAASLVNDKVAGQPRFGVRHDLEPSLLKQLLPVLRGAVSSERAKILMVDTSPRTTEFVSLAEAPRLATMGAACPDHLVHTKRVPLWIDYDPGRDRIEDLKNRIRGAAARYRVEYLDYVARHGDKTTSPADPDPCVVLIQRVGMVSVGTTPKASKLTRDLYRRAIEVMAGAEALGEFVPLGEAESFAAEYPPQRLAPTPRELEGKVALVTGAAGGIGRAIVGSLAAEGACIVGFDLDKQGACDAVAALGDAGLGVGGDVTSEQAVEAAYAAAVARFGGVDIVVSNAGVASSAPVEETTLEAWERNHAILSTGYFLISREAFKLLRAQDTGGSIVFVASKNALAAGKNTTAYSTAKAAEVHLARCLAEEGGDAGIRVNTVNPDAVLSGSKIWDGPWRADRAAAYGIAPEQLEEHYRQRNALKVNVLPEDVAAAVLHFASDSRSGKCTGNILNVDGGIAAAFQR